MDVVTLAAVMALASHIRELYVGEVGDKWKNRMGILSGALPNLRSSPSVTGPSGFFSSSLVNGTFGKPLVTPFSNPGGVDVIVSAGRVTSAVVVMMLRDVVVLVTVVSGPCETITVTNGTVPEAVVTSVLGESVVVMM